MRKFFMLCCMVFLTIHLANAQATVVGSENFDGASHTFTGGSWSISTDYAVSGTKSIWGLVPNLVGDSIILTSPNYNFSLYEFVTLRFSHICKVSPSDEVRVEYKDNSTYGSSWQEIPLSAYTGSASNYGTTGFNAASYTLWDAADSLATPAQSWWKEEFFDLRNELSFCSQAQFRFIIKRGTTPGSNISWGWLIDNFEVTGATFEIKPPTCEFISGPTDTVRQTGPFTVQAKVKTSTAARINVPYLKRTHTYNNVTTIDSVLMTHVVGDSVWQASIGKHLVGSDIVYSIYATDTTGNYATATSGYTIAFPTTGQGGQIIDSVQVGTSTSGGDCSYPWTTVGDGTNWSRSLYLAADIGTTNYGRTVAGLSYVNSYSYNHVRYSVQCYIMPTTAAAINTSGTFVDPIAAGATLAYDGNLQITGGWNFVEFDYYVDIPAGQNMMVWWIDTSSLNSCSQNTGTIYWAYNSVGYVGTDRAANNFSSGCGGSATAANVSTLSTTRVFFGNANVLSGSDGAAIKSVVINDTNITSPSTQIPVVAEIKNTGSSNLDSVTIGWSVNGVAQTPYTWTGNLPWDFVDTATIGTYNPRVNGYDTIAVWISMPNGAYDSVTYDDTVTEKIYGSADIEFTWLTVPADTVYSTGPHSLELRARSLSGHTVPSLSLVYSYLDTASLVIATDTLPMTYTGSNNVYTVSIPNVPYWHKVVYSVTVNDYLTNTVTTGGDYFIKKITGSGGGVYIQEAASASGYYPFFHGWGYSHSMSMYLASEMDNKVGLIDTVALRVSRAGTAGFPLKLYLLEVPASKTGFTTAEDWAATVASATLVYNGTFHFNQTGWVGLPLQNSFVYTGGNLIVLWEQNCGGSSCATYMSTYSMYYNYNAGNVILTNGYWYRYADNAPPTGAGYVYSIYRPDIHFSVIVSEDTNSVALEEIVSPSGVKSVLAGAHPINVVIRNKGIANLDSCIVGYSINGGTATTVNWTGNLPSDFVDTVTIGTYTAVYGQIENLTAWVSTPNGVYDSTDYDDTTSITVVPCAGPLNGNYTLGAGGTYDFLTFDAFVLSLKYCGINGRVNLQVANGTYAGGIDFADLKGLFTDTDTLLITSLSGTASDVVFTSSSNVVSLDGNKNIYLSNITLNASSGSGAGVNFVSPCENIEINGCVIMLSTTATTNTSAGIRYAGTSSSASMGNLRILNNTIENGYVGMYLYYLNPSYTVQSTSTSRVTIEGNTITNVYYYGIYSYYYPSYDFIRNNTISTRNVSSAQYGMYLYYYNRIDSAMDGNKIILNGTSTCYGIYDYYLNHTSSGAAGNAMITNNEIRKMAGSGAFYGIYVYYMRANIYHNSVYGQGTGTCYPLYISTMSSSYSADIRNNLFVAASSSTANYPIYASTASYATQVSGTTLDYNDYYSTGTSVGYIAGAQSTLSGLQMATGQDLHSINVEPEFKGVNSSLDFSNYFQFLTPAIQGVGTDIEGKVRTNPTIMGAYQATFDSLDAALPAFDTLNIQVLQNSAVNVILLNFGTTTFTSATINWSVDGVLQSPVAWTGSLSLMGQTNVLLGNVNLPGGSHTIKAWLSSVNGGTDNNTGNDTISETVYACSGALAGTYTVGSATADFATLDEAMQALNSCGRSSSVVLEFATGSYGSISLSNISGSTTNTLTITSMSGNANDVEFVGIGGNAITISGCSDLILTDVTFDAESGTNAVQFLGTNTNVEFYQCNIKAGPNATASTSAAVRYANASGSTSYIDDIRFIKNNISGGYYAFYLYYTMGSSANMTGKIGLTIDSNTITNAYYYNIYSYYYNVYNSISYNTISTRTAAVNQYGLYLYYYNTIHNGVVGNRILFNGTTYSYGIYAYYYLNNYGATGNALIANNEIRRVNGGTYGYGLYAYYPKLDFYNNSIYLAGTSTKYGIYISTMSSSYSLNIKNNIISLAGTGTNYPLYTSSANYAKQTYGTYLDYNDYYSTGTYLGYVGSTLTTLAALKTATGQDANSINLDPQFVDETVNLDLSDYLPFLTNRLTNVGTDINGQVRANVTTMGAYTPLISDGYDLKLQAVLGLPDAADFCSPDSAKIDFEVYNSSLGSFNFATDTLYLHLSVSGQTTLDTTVIIATDSISVLSRDTFEVLSNLNISLAGAYHITASISNVLDTATANDTIIIDYIANKVSLPLDVDFSNGIPLAMRTNIVTGTSDFYVLSDSNAAGTVVPQYSNKMLAFDGTRGSSARLLTRQLDLTGTSNPLIEFWYWHDSNSTAGSNDYTDVRLTFDGGATYTTLFQVTKRNAALDHGWTKYTYDLSQYTQNSCIIVVFESMRMSLPAYDGEQYIDRIRLVSDQDLALGKLVAPAINACTQTADLAIALENMTSQAINFANYPTSLKVDITGAITQSYTVPLNSGTVGSLATDTITVVPNFNFAAGTYYVYAKLLTAVDNTPANDEMRDTLVVNPELTVAATAVTGGNGMTNCIVAGSKVAQVVNIANSGNMDMEDLVLTLSVSNESGAVVETITDTILGTFAVNATVSHTFASTYTVPTGGELYNVQVVVAPLCNAAMDFDNIITECVDLSDIEIVAILAPDASSTNCDAVGSTIKVKAQLRNNHPNDDYQNIVIHAEVTANSGASLGSWTETINEIQAGSTLDFEFPQGFAVPNEANYTVKVYVNNIDGNAGNDTLSATKCTDLGIGEGDVNGISMSQNIPNPAETNARVQYSVPTSGQVVFTLTTVTGQIIYSESVNVESGVHYIDFNTVNLANGIYFYTMDFNGQRLVKKMSVRN